MFKYDYEDLRRELILTLSLTKFKDDPENSENLKYLHSMDISSLDQMLGEYYLHEIKLKK